MVLLYEWVVSFNVKLPGITIQSKKIMHMGRNYGP